MFDRVTKVCVYFSCPSVIFFLCVLFRIQENYVYALNLEVKKSFLYTDFDAKKVIICFLIIKNKDALSLPDLNRDVAKQKANFTFMLSSAILTKHVSI